MPTRVVTHSIDFRKLLFTYLSLKHAKDGDKESKLARFLQILGLDPSLPYEGNPAGCYTGLKIAKIAVQFY